MMLFDCKECGREFSAQKGLHRHLTAGHKMSQKQYYEKHYPKHNKLTGKRLRFKNYSDYFIRDFTFRDQFVEWCNITPKEEVGPYIEGALLRYVKKKDTELAPCYTEMLTEDYLPSVKAYEDVFGDFDKYSEKLGLKPMFKYGRPSTVKSLPQAVIQVDTREQKPFAFFGRETVSHKLDCGDYCLDGKFFNRIFIDRKSDMDFKSTLSTGVERFRQEIERCKELNCFLYIVVEANIATINKRNVWAPHKSNLNWIYHNMRSIQRDYLGYCQFLFCDTKYDASQTSLLLLDNPHLKDYDVQHLKLKNVLDYGETK